MDYRVMIQILERFVALGADERWRRRTERLDLAALLIADGRQFHAL